MVAPTSENTPRDLVSAVEAYRRNAALAHSIIIDSCVDRIVLLLENIDEPADVWKYLESKFQPTGAVKDYTAWIDLITMTFDGKDLRTFCDEYELALRACHQLDIYPEERLIIYHFIHLITPYFESYSCTLRDKMSEQQSGQAPPLSLEQVIGRVLQEKGKSSNNSAPGKPKEKSKAGSTRPRRATHGVKKARKARGGAPRGGGGAQGGGRAQGGGGARRGGGGARGGL